MEINKAKAVAFSGYRTSKIESTFRNLGSFHKIEMELYKVLSDLTEKGYNTFIVGGAVGFETIVAEKILLLKEYFSDIILVVAVPFLEQDSKYNEKDKKTYRWILEHADYIHCISDTHYDKVYHDRNDYMLDNSSHLVCYYNGLRGGTMYTYNRAVKRGVNITNLYDEVNRQFI